MSEEVDVEELLVQLNRRAIELGRAALVREQLRVEQAEAAAVEATTTTTMAAPGVTTVTTTMAPVVITSSAPKVSGVNGLDRSVSATGTAASTSATAVRSGVQGYTTRSPINRRAYWVRDTRPPTRVSVAATATKMRPDTTTAAVEETSAAVLESRQTEAPEVAVMAEEVPEAELPGDNSALEGLTRVAKAVAVETAVTFSEALAEASAGADSTEDAVLQAAGRTVEVRLEGKGQFNTFRYIFFVWIFSNFL